MHKFIFAFAALENSSSLAIHRCVTVRNVGGWDAWFLDCVVCFQDVFMKKYIGAEAPPWFNLTDNLGFILRILLESNIRYKTGYLLLSAATQFFISPVKLLLRSGTNTWSVFISWLHGVKVKVRVKVTPEQTTKAERGSKYVTLLFL